MKVLLPTTLDEALAALAEAGAAGDVLLPMAGGTDLLVHWPQNLDAHDRAYLDLSGLEATLRPHVWQDDALVLGAATTYWDILCDRRAGEEFPLLHQAARQVGAVQIQARGTWAGNVVNASPAADGTAVLMAYGAVVELVSAEGTEEIPLDAFYLGYKSMRRRPDQLVRAIRLPRRAHDVEIFEKVGSRRAQAITKVGVAATRLAGAASLPWRVVAVSMAPTTCRCPALEARLAEPGAVESAAEFQGLVRRDVQPIDDIRSTAAYREKVFARVLFHALGGRADLR